MEKKEKAKKLIVFLWLLCFCICSADAAIETKDLDLTVAAPWSPVLILNGLSARAIFTYDDTSPFELKIELFNTSTGVPSGFIAADQLLTGISFNLGGPSITAGIAVIGPGSESIAFDAVVTQLGPGDDVSGEWGYGNTGTTGMYLNLVSTNGSHTTAMGSVNLDGPAGLDGPQGGLCTDPPVISLGGQGAIADSIVINLTLNSTLPGLGFIDTYGVVAEFGSDAAFLTPEPATIFLLGMGSLMLFRRK